jgi:Protein of unknown function (DUF2934)
VPVSVNTTQKVLRSAPIPSSRRPAAIEEVIRRRAYQLYVEGGRREGHTKEDWLRAESEPWLSHQDRGPRAPPCPLKLMCPEARRARG